jgi:hypothetical protein
MTATIRPIRCPHGSDTVRLGYAFTTYEDGCRATSGAPVRFWCGPDEMSKPNGVSITEGEYLTAWADALILNDGDELYDEAENTDYFRTVEAADHAEYQRFMDENPPKCAFRGLISKRPCALPLDHDGVHSVWGDTDPWTVQAMNGQEHADFLGEVPWSDRVDD